MFTLIFVRNFYSSKLKKKNKNICFYQCSTFIEMYYKVNFLINLLIRLFMLTKFTFTIKTCGYFLHFNIYLLPMLSN